MGPFKFSLKLKPYRDSIIPCLVILLLFSVLSSCGLGVRMRKLAGDKQVITVSIDSHMNHDNPIAIDIVHVYDKTLLARLREMPAKEWFASREQIKRDYAQGQGLDVWQKEWIPGQITPRYKLPLKPRAKGAVIFANYYTPGAHRFFINPFDDIKIEFLENDFIVTPD